MSIRSTSRRDARRATGARDARGATPAPTASRRVETTERRRRGDRFDGTRHGRSERPASRAVGGAGLAAAPARLELVERHKIYDALPSGLLALGGDRFLVVDDDIGICLVRPGENAQALSRTDEHPELADLEGICWSPEREAIYVVSEATRKVYALSFARSGDEVRLGEPVELGRLPRVRSGHDNKGWEGIETAPGRFFADGKPRLLAVKEGFPRRVGVFLLPGLERECLLKLPEEAKPYLADLSDLAVCPETGHLFLLSDESSAVVEMELRMRRSNAPGALLDASELKLLGITKLDTKKRDKPEGIVFGPDGALWISTDGRGGLLRYHVTRD